MKKTKILGGNRPDSRAIIAVFGISLLIVGCGKLPDKWGHDDDDENYAVDFCRLQTPAMIDALEGAGVDVFGRVYSAGLTDMSDENDPADELIAEAGYGPDGSDPATSPDWIWFDGTPNAGYGSSSPDYDATHDEYVATLSVSDLPGDYDFAYRFSADSGDSFTYCDTGEGTNDGYDPAAAGQMAVRQASPYFSEYIEGSSFNKALEIYNPSALDADLSSCAVNIYANGNLAPGRTIPLAGSSFGDSLGADSVMVLCNINIDALAAGSCNLSTPSNDLNYNGDDALELVCDSTTLDVIGRIGEDPGSAWSDGISTQDETLRRKCTVTTGDTDGSDAFLPSVEWDGFVVDDFTDLGQYVCP